MYLMRRGRKPKTADVPITFKPFRTDLVTIDSLAQAASVQRPEMVRKLVSEAIKQRNLKAIGKQEALDDVVQAQKKAMAQVLAPFAEKLNSISNDLRRVEGRIADEFTQAEKRLNFLVLCARFIVFEVFVCRQLLSDYVHTVYMKFVQSINKPLKDIEANFDRRVQKYKAEAAGALDDLSESSVDYLHAMTDESPGFRYE